MNLIIRPILEKDNQAIKNIIQNVLAEFGCIGPGFASNDAELNNMFAAYQMKGAGYYILESSLDNEILGGGGFAPLNGSLNKRICELRKVYFLPSIRGKNLGKILLEKIFTSAREEKYEEIYLETIDKLSAAVKLYEKSGFRKLDIHKGNTGHQHSCTIYMNKLLKD